MDIKIIGAGPAGLSVAYYAKKFGCQVHGITLSQNQLNYCKEKARELKLDNFLSCTHYSTH